MTIKTQLIGRDPRQEGAGIDILVQYVTYTTIYGIPNRRGERRRRELNYLIKKYIKFREWVVKE